MKTKILGDFQICISVPLKRKENSVLKMLLQEKAKAQLEINGLVEGLFRTTNLNVHLHGFV